MFAETKTYTGRPIECVTTAVNEAARTASLRAHPKSVYEAVVRSSFMSFNGLVPGMMFNAIVDSIIEVSPSLLVQKT